MRAITGNGTPKICAAGWARTLLQDNVLLISQNEAPESSEYARCVRYHALIIAITQSTIILINFFFITII